MKLIKFPLFLYRPPGMSLTERINQIESMLAKIDSSSNVIDTIYPVGSIYISATDATVDAVTARFGGEWEVYAQGRTLIGVGSTTDASNNALVYNANAEGGSTTTTLSTSNLPSHNHSIPALSGTAANSGSGYTLTYNTTGTNNASTGSQSANHTHSIPALSGSTNNTGAHAHNLIYNGSTLTGYGGIAEQDTGWNSGVFKGGSGLSMSSAGAHSHTVTTNASTTGSNSANHNHKYTNRYVTGISGVASHSHTVTTTASTSGNTGSGAAFSVQDPYITVYMYKRIK